MCAWGTTVNKVEINVLVKFIFSLGETDNNKHNKQITLFRMFGDKCNRKNEKPSRVSGA